MLDRDRMPIVFGEQVPHPTRLLCEGTARPSGVPGVASLGPELELPPGSPGLSRGLTESRTESPLLPDLFLQGARGQSPPPEMGLAMRPPQVTAFPSTRLTCWGSRGQDGGSWARRAVSRLRAMGRSKAFISGALGSQLPAGPGLRGRLCRLHTWRLFIPGVPGTDPAPPTQHRGAVLMGDRGVCAQRWSLRSSCWMPQSKGRAVLSRVRLPRVLAHRQPPGGQRQPGVGARGPCMSLP